MGTITLDSKQQRRADILVRLLSGNLTIEAAAQHLGLSPRQARRLKIRYQQEGLRSVLHGNQGRAPANRTAAEIREKIRQLAGADGPFSDFNTCHLQEKLAQQDIALGRSTLDRLLKDSGLRKPRKERPTIVRRRRERRSAEGMLLQIDASAHDWLEGRGPRLCLLGAIDDATSRICYARFHLCESQMGYLLMLRTIAIEHGLPMSYYHDKHTILRSPKEATLDEQLAGTGPMSQIQRILQGLGVESIAAHSPQAKGRIERLWQTWQDRLIKEMRLADVCTQEEANAFLPSYLPTFNARFCCPAADPEAAWVALARDMDLVYYFSIRQERTVRADHTLSFEGQCLQIVRTPGTASLAGKRVGVHVVPEADLYLYQDQRLLRYTRVEKSIDTPTPQIAASTNVASTSVARVAAARPKASARQRAWLYGSH